MKIIDKDRVQYLKENKDALLADLRSPVEYRDSHVNGSENLPFPRNFCNKLVGMDKKKPIVLISWTTRDDDVRLANNYAEQLGFTKVHAIDFNSLSR